MVGDYEGLCTWIIFLRRGMFDAFKQNQERVALADNKINLLEQAFHQN